MIVLSDVQMPTEGVHIAQAQVQAYFDTECAGEGTLCVSERSVTWVNRQSQKGFSLTYPSIILHAVSTDLSSFAQEHIYVLVDCSKAERRRRQVPLYTAEEARDLNMTEPEDSGDADDADSDDSPSVQIRFVPTDISTLQQIYQAMADCQELNPDEDDISDEEGDDGEEMVETGDPMQSGQWFTAENMGEDFELSEEGRANLMRMMGGGQNGHGDGEEMDEN